MSSNTELYLSVGGMSCGGCTGIVESAASHVAGVQSVTCPFISRTKSIATIKMRSDVDPKDVIAALTEMDFEAEVVSERDALQFIKESEEKPKKSKKSKSVEQESLLSEPVTLIEVVTPTEDQPPSKAILSVRGMTCAACVATIENYVKAQRGVVSVAVGLLAEKAEVYYDSSLVTKEQIKESIDEIGYEATILAESDGSVLHLSVGGMTCAACVSIIENVLQNEKGIKEVSVSLATNTAKVKYDNDLTGPRTIIALINDIGYQAALAPERPTTDIMEKKEELNRIRRELFISLAFTVPVFFIGMILHRIHFFEQLFMVPVVTGLSFGNFLLFLLTTPVQFGIGKRFYINAYKVMKHGGANMDVLIVIGTTASYFYSLFAVLMNMKAPKTHSVTVFFDTSAMLISFVLLGKYLETVAKGKTSEAIRKLMSLQPSTALLMVTDENGRILEEKSIEIDLVQRGDTLKVLPGTKIPTDGTVMKGLSTVDESIITGESMPVTKKPGDSVIGGTMNQSGMIIVKATRVGQETGLAQIIRLVQDAQTEKAPIQSFADRVAGIFVPIVVVLSILTFIVWFIISSSSGIPEPYNEPGTTPFLFSLLFSISVVVIACPCALGLATPTAIMVGTGIGAINGVLIKGGLTLETAHKISAVLFDKTGTLTYGKPMVTDHILLTKKMTRQQFFKLAAIAESGSEHPLAKAVVNYAVEVEGVQVVPPERFEAISGEGIYCVYESQTIIIGNRLFMGKNKVELSGQIDDIMQGYERDGKTAVLVSINNEVAGIISIADRIKPEARITVNALRKMGIESWMVTGDNSRTAKAIAAQIGVSHVFAEVLPSDKARKVKEIRALGHVVAMVGDGINDSPALAEADVGIAIGAGTDIAIEAAGMVLVKSDLRDVVTAIDLSKRTFNRIKLNYLWATIYNVCGIPLAAGLLMPVGIIVPPMIAGFCMAFSSVSVVVSSLLLKTYKKPAIYEDFKPEKYTSKGNEEEIELLPTGQFLSEEL